MTALLAATFLALRFTAPADAHGHPVSAYAAQRSTDHGLTCGSAVGFGLAYGDSDTVRVWHQEQVQRGEAARLCRDYGYVDLRGARDNSECAK